MGVETCMAQPRRVAFIQTVMVAAALSSRLPGEAAILCGLTPDATERPGVPVLARFRRLIG